MNRYEDPADALNGAKYRTEIPCIEGCGRPAGTAWSPFWCHQCNAIRMNRVSASLESMLEKASQTGEQAP